MARILFLNHTSKISGAEHSLLDLVEHLDRGRFTPLVAAPPDGPLGRELEARGVRVHLMCLRRLKRTINPLRLAGYAAARFWCAFQLKRLIHSHDVQLVHANSTTAHVFGGLAARWSGVPAIWHVRDLRPLGPFRRYLANDAAKIIAISQAVRGAVLDEQATGAKVEVVPNGVDPRVFRPDLSGEEWRRRLGVGPEQSLVGMVAQLVPWKRHRAFLRAAAEVARYQPQAHFVIIGTDLFGDHPGYEGDLKDHCRQLGIRDRVSFAGYVRPVAPLIAALDLLVLPSDQEPFGRVLIEAMACGKPVIAMASAGPLEIVEEGVTGYLIPPVDILTMASAIRTLVADRERAARLGQAGRRRVLEQFTIQHTVRRIERIYEELLSPPLAHAAVPA